MTAWRVLLARARALFVRRRMDQELDDEIQAHLDHLTAEHQRHGLSLDDARRAARRDFGGLDGTRERVRDERGFAWLDAFSRDTRYAVRTLLRTPAFTLAAVGTLASGLAQPRRSSALPMQRSFGPCRTRTRVTCGRCEPRSPMGA